MKGTSRTQLNLVAKVGREEEREKWGGRWEPRASVDGTYSSSSRLSRQVRGL